MSEEYKKYPGGNNSISSTYKHTSARPFLDDEVFTSLSGLYSLKYPHFGKHVTVVAPAERSVCGVYVLVQMPSDNPLHSDSNYATMFLFDETVEDEDQRPVDGNLGRSKYVGWKKIDDGGSSLQIEDKNGDPVTVDKIASGDVYIEKDEETNEYKLVLNEDLELAIFGGDSTGSGDIIELPTSKAYTIDGYTLNTNEDNTEGTGDDNEIYVATTDGGTWNDENDEK